MTIYTIKDVSNVKTYTQSLSIASTAIGSNSHQLQIKIKKVQLEQYLEINGKLQSSNYILF